MSHVRGPALALIGVFGLLLSAGCAERPARSVVEASDAARCAGDPSIVFLDVRAPEPYAQGHVKGAARIDPSEWKAASLDAREGLENVAVWESRIGDAGVRTDDRVLIYDGGEMVNAARVWFILQHFGQANASVVNGGWRALEAAAEKGALAVATEQTRATPRKSAARVRSRATIGMVDRAGVRDAVQTGGARIVDSRKPEEYAGVEAHENPRPGHLPNAVNIPHAELLTADGKLKSGDELAEIFEKAGLKKGEPIIVHCESGGRASLEALAAARAGYGPVQNYYRSFSDWSRDDACPVERK